MSTDDPNTEQDALDWVRTHPERVEALAESDRRMADAAAAVLDYLDGDETEGFEMFRPGSTPTFYTGADAEQAARKVRAALTDTGGRE